MAVAASFSFLARLGGYDLLDLLPGAGIVTGCKAGLLVSVLLPVPGHGIFTDRAGAGRIACHGIPLSLLFRGGVRFGRRRHILYIPHNPQTIPASPR